MSENAAPPQVIHVFDLPGILTTWIYLVRAVTVAIGTAFLWLVGRDLMEVPFWSAWGLRGGLFEGLAGVWFVFVWAVVSTVVLNVVAARRGFGPVHSPGTILRKGSWMALNAGVFEEVLFRWLLFLGAMVIIRFVDEVTFGLVHWVYTTLLIPVANVFTFHALSPQLLGPSWVLAAAVVSSNAKFRAGHVHLGFIGWVNAWFIGMVMFWLMFHHGLLTAIIAHVLYDWCVFVAVAGFARA